MVNRSSRLACKALLLIIVSASSGVWASDPNGEEQRTLRFAFDRAPWRSVLSWVAEESNLALFISEVPTGTFTYTDPKLFTPEETIDRINLFLIPEGYTFVRSGSLLSLISLGDPRSMKQLDAMAKLVALDELADRGNYEVVKCIFPLGKADSSLALSELNSLGLMTQPVVLAATNQLLLTDTAGRLKTVQRVLAALESKDRGSDLVKSFVLKHATADEVLAVARPHLGIEADEFSGFDVSLSADIAGTKLFATGSKQSVDLLETLVEVVDRPDREDQEERVLKSHAVSGENLQTVYEVLLTLLADQSIRLSEDRNTNSIVALAPAETHVHIAQTIAELDGPDKQFAVIELKTLNPYAAMNLLNQFFGVEEDDEEYEWWDWRRRRDDNDDQAEAPKIQADLARKRLLVRGTPQQIEEIKRVIQSLDVVQETDGNVRLLPALGAQSTEVLELARRLWRGKNPVVLEATEQPTGAKERTAHPAPRPVETTEDRPDSAQATLPQTMVAQLVRPVDGESPIRIRVTPQGGIVLESDDEDALDAFSEHLRSVAEVGSPADAAEPVVFYLKYATADEATKMLADLLDGARWLNTSSGGFLDGSDTTTASTGSYWGSFIMNRDGLTTMTAGSATVVSDARLNRLIVQGTAEDVAVIEGYLRVIDKESSITDIETYGRSRVIALEHAQVDEVAQVLREAYGARIAGSNAQQSQRNNEGRRERRDEDEDEERGDRDDEQRRRPAGRAPRNREVEMTLAVHEESNSLIVTAPEPLFREVERLAKLLDARAEQTMEIVIPQSMSGRYVEAMLYNALRQGDSPARTLGRPAERDARQRRGERNGRREDD